MITKILQIIFLQSQIFLNIKTFFSKVRTNTTYPPHIVHVIFEQPHMIIKHNQFSGQFWKMEGNNLTSKAGMVFNSDDKWKLIPLVEANLQAKFEIVNLTCKFWLEIC